MSASPAKKLISSGEVAERPARTRVPRRRQDMDIPELQRRVNDRSAEDFYAQLMLNSVRGGTDPNDSDNEEEVEWYVQPQFDAKKAQERGAENSKKVKSIMKQRLENLKKLRTQPEHKKLKPFDRIAAEAELWTGQRGTTGELTKASPRKEIHRQNSQFTETLEEQDEVSQMAGGTTTTNAGGAVKGDETLLTTSPSYLRGKLRKYQLDGVSWMVNLHDRCINGILADEMGLGKTFQSVSLLAYLKYTRGLPGPHLVVAPKSVLGNWFREFKKWCPTLNVFKFHGDSEIRPMLVKAHLKAPLKSDIVLTTYEMVVKEVHAFRKIQWKYMVIDEAHKLKNAEATTHQALDELKTEHRLLVTGTPLQNDLKELWALLHFLAPELFNESEHFVKWFDAQTGEEDKEAVGRMHVMLAPLMLRRLKSEAATELPPKVEIYVGCRLAKMQRDWYLNVLAKDADAINRGGNTGGGRERLSNICMQLRKVCNHPYLFEGAEEGPPFRTDENIIKASGKMVVMDRLLSKLRAKPEEHHKVLIFSQMTRVLDILEDYLTFRGYKYFRIDGGTSGLERDTQMAQFNNPKSDYFIFLLSTRAGGLGINLQTANHVILYDSDWNPQMDLQAQDRAHRIGQTRPVRVYRFITDNTFEERIYRRALKKLYLDAVVVEQGRLAKKNANASKDELLSMIKFGAADVFKTSDNKEMSDDEIDKLLETGEAKLKGLQDQVNKDTQATLATFKMGIDDGNFYEFEGINFRDSKTSANISKLLHVKLPEPMSEEEITKIASPFGELIKVTAHPNGKEALLNYRSTSGASDAYAGLPSEWDAQYCSKEGELVVTGEMIDQGFEVGEASRSKKRAEVEALTEKHLSELQASTSGDANLPLKLPKKPNYHAFQLFNRERLWELHDTEVALLVKRWTDENKLQQRARRIAHQADRLFDVVLQEEREKDKAKLKESGEEVTYTLTSEELDERDRLLEEGFASWTHAHFTVFKKALPEVRPDDYKGLAEKMRELSDGAVEKSEGEVRDYAKAFWARGKDCLGEETFSNIEKRLSRTRDPLGMPGWAYADFTAFKKAVPDVHPDDYKGLALQMKEVSGGEVDKTEDEVREYSKAFWSRGKEALGEAAFSFIDKRMNKIRERIKKEQEVKDALQWKMEQYENPTAQFKVGKWKEKDLEVERTIFFEAYDNQMKCDSIPAKVASLPENRFDVFWKTRDSRFYETRVQNVVRTIVMEKKDHDFGGTGWRKRKRDADANDGGRLSENMASAAAAEASTTTTAGGGNKESDEKPNKDEKEE